MDYSATYVLEIFLGQYSHAWHHHSKATQKTEGYFVFYRHSFVYLELLGTFLYYALFLTLGFYTYLSHLFVKSVLSCYIETYVTDYKKTLAI